MIRARFTHDRKEALADPVLPADDRLSPFHIFEDHQACGGCASKSAGDQLATIKPFQYVAFQIFHVKHCLKRLGREMFRAALYDKTEICHGHSHIAPTLHTEAGCHGPTEGFAGRAMQGAVKGIGDAIVFGIDFDQHAIGCGDFRAGELPLPEINEAAGIGFAHGVIRLEPESSLAGVINNQSAKFFAENDKLFCQCGRKAGPFACPLWHHAVAAGIASDNDILVDSLEFERSAIKAEAVAGLESVGIGLFKLADTPAAGHDDQRFFGINCAAIHAEPANDTAMTNAKKSA
jgi:hypothetical protein